MSYRTQDEALAEALAESQPGDIVTVHERSCASITAVRFEDVSRLCTCEPMELVVGAQA